MKDASIPDPPNVLVYNGFTFNISKKIGEGGFARCYEVNEGSSGRKFAIKAIHSEAIAKLRAKSKLLNEIEIHHCLDHRYIVKLYRVFQDEAFVYLVLELCENKTMVELLRQRKTLTESEVRHYIWMIITAVNYLHEKNIIHRDLKLGNIFLNLEYDVKIGDFGLATTLDQIGDRKKTICGTPNYIAPEILFDKERGHSFEVDIWAIGVIMYSLLFGRAPFQSNEVKNIYKNIKENAYNFPPTAGVSEAAKSLITLILTPDPDKRPKLSMIAEHEFFKYVIIKEPSSADISAIRVHCTRLSMKANKAIDLPPLSVITKENIPPKNAGSEPYAQAKAAISSLGKESTKKLSAVETVFYSLCKYLDPSRSNLVHYQEPSITMEHVKPPSFYIEKWIDYTNKYGLGYLGSNGNIGAYFNDSTSIIMNPYTRIFEYQYQEIQGNHRQLIRLHYKNEEFPPDLTKKMTIVKHFQSNLALKSTSNLNHYATTTGPNEDVSTSDVHRHMDFLVKYARMKEAMIFRLSNRAIQAIFLDASTLLLSNDGLVVTLIDEHAKSRSSHALPDLMANPEGHFKTIDKLGQLMNMLESLLNADKQKQVS